MVELPVIESSDPNHEYTVDDIDWQYMEDRIKELEEDRIKELEAYLKATNLDDYELTDEDKKVLSRKSASNENGSLETDCEDGALRFKAVSYTHLRAHETIKAISYAVFCLKKKNKK